MWWRKTVEAILAGPRDHTHQRLNRGHRELGKRRLDELVQKVAGESRRQEPWWDEANNRDAQKQLETVFIQTKRPLCEKATRPAMLLDAGRFQKQDYDVGTMDDRANHLNPSFGNLHEHRTRLSTRKSSSLPEHAPTCIVSSI